jgi:hypothetical protein
MKKFFLFLSLASLAFCVACGGSSGPAPSGNFSNSTLSGQYTYQLNGIDNANGAFRESGVFTADGAGHITAGTDDLFAGTALLSGITTGSYAISNDGTGTLTLNVGNGRTLDLAITAVTSSKVYLMVADAGTVAAVGGGIAEKQDATAFTTTPSGTFIFQLHNLGSNDSESDLGQMVINSGAITGLYDVNNTSALVTPTITSGALNAPDASGRGTGSFTDDSNFTIGFVYYVVNANNLRFLVTSLNGQSGWIGNGRAEKQSAGPFSTASLSGSYAFGSRGDTAFNPDSSKTVGRFTADGNGNLSAGAMDGVVDGTQTTINTSFTGSYAVDSLGRADLTIAPSGGSSFHDVAWLVAPNRALFLVDSADVEDGSMDLQTTTSFSNITMTGQFGFVMHGYNVTVNQTYDRVGTLQWDGAGHLTLNEAVNAGGTISVPGFLGGSYSVSSNGRATGSINSLSNNLVFYLISGSDGYVLQNDAGIEIDGSISKQQ